MRSLITQSVEGFYQIALQEDNAIAGSNSCMQFANIEGLSEVVIRSRVKPLHYVSLFIFSRDEQNILIPVRLPGADATAELDAVDSRHHPVQNKQIRSHFPLQQFPSLTAILDGDHPVAPTLQPCLQDSTENRIVFRNQYLATGGISGFNPAQDPG